MASTPVRICDQGGWTDTWFGGPGRVLNVAVTPGVEVSIRTNRNAGEVVLDVADFGDRYTVVPGRPRHGRHRLLEAAVDTVPPPPGRGVEIRVGSGVPAGCGTGTSASVAVALLGALTALRGDTVEPLEMASAAHRLEVDVLGGESGVQDQISAAFGGINFVEIDNYPEARVTALPAWDALGPCLTLLFLGRPHESSALHRQVIERARGGRAGALSGLRGAALAARDAVRARDMEGFGKAMIQNTEAQRSLHPDLVGHLAHRVIDSAEALGAIGWKVNGAGGEGGSLTLLSRSGDHRRALEDRLVRTHPACRALPIALSSRGLTIRRLES